MLLVLVRDLPNHLTKIRSPHAHMGLKLRYAFMLFVGIGAKVKLSCWITPVASAMPELNG